MHSVLPWCSFNVKNNLKYRMLTCLVVLCFGALMSVMPLVSEQFLNMSLQMRKRILNVIPFSLWDYQNILFLWMIVHRQKWILLKHCLLEWAHILVIASQAKSKKDTEGKPCFLLLAPLIVVNNTVIPTSCALEN